MGSVKQGRSRLSSEQKAFLFIGLLLIIIGIVVQLLGKYKRIPQDGADVASIILTGFGLIITLLTYIDPLKKNLAINFRNIAKKPSLFTYNEPIQPCTRSVDEIYRLLFDPNITGVVLTGLGGIGKSTLAALVYRYVEEQQSTMPLFSHVVAPIWLDASDGNVSMTQLGKTILMELGKPWVDFDDVPDQASKLFEALNDKGKRLIILDQFDSLLDPQTGLAKDKDIGAWLDKVNHMPCKSRLLFTSRFCPQGNSGTSLQLLKEYPIRGLGIIEGGELLETLLRKQNIKIKETVLRRVVEQCGGHPRALKELAILLQKYHEDVDIFLNNLTYARIWRNEIASADLEDSYMKRLKQNRKQYELLLAFSIYREAVTLDAVLPIRSFVTGMEEHERLSACEELKKQHLLQDFGGHSYKPHIVIAGYAQDHFVENNDSANLQELKDAHQKAASYYQNIMTKTSLSPNEYRRMLIEAAWHYLQAGDKKRAYEVLDNEPALTYLLNISR